MDMMGNRKISFPAGNQIRMTVSKRKIVGIKNQNKIFENNDNHFMD
jgi:hypothetical protein